MDEKFLTPQSGEFLKKKVRLSVQDDTGNRLMITGGEGGIQVRMPQRSFTFSPKDKGLLYQVLRTLQQGTQAYESEERGANAMGADDLIKAVVEGEDPSEVLEQGRFIGDAELLRMQGFLNTCADFKRNLNREASGSEEKAVKKHLLAAVKILNQLPSHLSAAIKAHKPKIVNIPLKP